MCYFILSMLFLIHFFFQKYRKYCPNMWKILTLFFMKFFLQKNNHFLRFSTVSTAVELIFSYFFFDTPHRPLPLIKARISSPVAGFFFKSSSLLRNEKRHVTSPSIETIETIWFFKTPKKILRLLRASFLNARSKDFTPPQLSTWFMHEYYRCHHTKFKNNAKNF